MRALRRFIRKIPVLPLIYSTLRSRLVGYRLKSKNAEEIFTQIYEHDTWGGSDSVSGTGSDVHQTRIVSDELPGLLKDFGISTMLDIPCGDFYWMQNVDLCGIDYTGADVVKEIVQKNGEEFVREGVRFQHLDLINDELPKVDLIFCRDCLVHFSFSDVLLAIKNVCNSESKYLLTTTFTDRKINRDIATGQWRALNLELEGPSGITVGEDQARHSRRRRQF